MNTKPQQVVAQLKQLSSELKRLQNFEQLKKKLRELKRNWQILGAAKWIDGKFERYYEDYHTAIIDYITMVDRALALELKNPRHPNLNQWWQSITQGLTADTNTIIQLLNKI